MFGQGFSEEYKKYLYSGLKCSNCNARFLRKPVGDGLPKLYLKDGTELENSLSNSVEFFMKNSKIALLECHICGYRWNMYKESNSIISSKFEFVSIEETHKSEDIFDTTERLIDNSKGTNKIPGIYKFGEERSKTYSIQYDNAQVKGKQLNLGMKLSDVDLGSIKVTSEETLKKQYSISEEIKEIRGEELNYVVDEFIKQTITFNRIRIWQHGIIKFRHQDNTEFDIPFKVIKGVKSEMIVDV